MGAAPLSIRRLPAGQAEEAEQLSEGDPQRRKLAEQLLSAPRNFQEGANEATKKLANSI